MPHSLEKFCECRNTAALGELQLLVLMQRVTGKALDYRGTPPSWFEQRSSEGGRVGTIRMQ